MKQPTHLPLNKPANNANKRGVIYVPPSEKLVETYAHVVYDALQSKSCLAANTNKAEFIRGFSAFIKVINRIQVKHLNKGVLYDEEQSQPSIAA